jgi:hypothetical protein
MDVLCRHCGEPWELDFIHDTSEVSHEDRKRFYAGKGCPSCNGDPSMKVDTEGTAAMAALVDVLGDDVDGIAASLEDFGLT